MPRQSTKLSNNNINNTSNKSEDDDIILLLQNYEQQQLIAEAAGVSLTQTENYLKENLERLKMDQTFSAPPENQDENKNKNANDENPNQQKEQEREQDHLLPADLQNNNNNNQSNQQNNTTKWASPPLYHTHTLYSIVSYTLWYGGANCLSYQELAILHQFMNLPVATQLLVTKLLLRKRRILSFSEIVKSYGDWIKSIEAAKDLDQYDAMMMNREKNHNEDDIVVIGDVNANTNPTNTTTENEKFLKLQSEILLNISPEVATRKYLDDVIQNDINRNNQFPIIRKWDSTDLLTQLEVIKTAPSATKQQQLIQKRMLFKVHSFIEELCTIRMLRQMLWHAVIVNGNQGAAAANNKKNNNNNTLDQELLLTQQQLTEQLPNVYQDNSTSTMYKLSKHALVAKLCENFDRVHETRIWDQVVGPVYFLCDHFRAAVQAVSEVFQMVCGETLSDTLVDTAVRSMHVSQSLLNNFNNNNGSGEPTQNEKTEDAFEEEEKLKRRKEQKQQRDAVKNQKQQQKEKPYLQNPNHQSQTNNNRVTTTISSDDSSSNNDDDDEDDDDFGGMMMMRGGKKPAGATKTKKNTTAKTTKKVNNEQQDEQDEPSSSSSQPQQEQFPLLTLPQYKIKAALIDVASSSFGGGSWGSSAIVNSSTDAALLTIPFEILLTSLFQSRRDGAIGGGGGSTNRSDETTAHPTAFFTADLPLIPHYPEFFSNNNNTSLPGDRKAKNNNKNNKPSEPEIIDLDISQAPSTESLRPDERSDPNLKEQLQLQQQQVSIISVDDDDDDDEEENQKPKQQKILPPKIHLWSNPLFGALCREAQILNAYLFELLESPMSSTIMNAALKISSSSTNTRNNNNESTNTTNNYESEVRKILREIGNLAVSRVKKCQELQSKIVLTDEQKRLLLENTNNNNNSNNNNDTTSLSSSAAAPIAVETLLLSLYPQDEQELDTWWKDLYLSNKREVFQRKKKQIHQKLLLLQNNHQKRNNEQREDDDDEGFHENETGDEPDSNYINRVKQHKTTEKEHDHNHHGGGGAQSSSSFSTTFRVFLTSGDLSQYDHPAKRFVGTGTRIAHLVNFLPQYQWLNVLVQLVPCLEKRRMYQECVIVLDTLLSKTGVISLDVYNHHQSTTTPRTSAGVNGAAALAQKPVDPPIVKIDSTFFLNFEKNNNQQQQPQQQNQHQHQHHHHIIHFVPSRKFAFFPRKRGEWHHRLLTDLWHLKRDSEAFTYGECLLGFVEPLEKLFKLVEVSEQNGGKNTFGHIGANGIPQGVHHRKDSEYLSSETINYRRLAANRMPFGFNQEMRWMRGFDVLSLEKTFKKLCKPDRRLGGIELILRSPTLLSNRLKDPLLVYVTCKRDELTLLDLRLKTNVAGSTKLDFQSNSWDSGNRVEIAAMKHYQKHLLPPVPLFESVYDPKQKKHLALSLSPDAIDELLSSFPAIEDADFIHQIKKKDAIFKLNRMRQLNGARGEWKGAHVEGGWIFIIFSAVFEKALMAPYSDWKGAYTGKQEQHQNLQQHISSSPVCDQSTILTPFEVRPRDAREPCSLFYRRRRQLIEDALEMVSEMSVDQLANFVNDWLYKRREMMMNPAFAKSQKKDSIENLLKQKNKKKDLLLKKKKEQHQQQQKVAVAKRPSKIEQLMMMNLQHPQEQQQQSSQEDAAAVVDADELNEQDEQQEEEKALEELEEEKPTKKKIQHPAVKIIQSLPNTQPLCNLLRILAEQNHPSGIDLRFGGFPDLVMWFEEKEKNGNDDDGDDKIPVVVGDDNNEDSISGILSSVTGSPKKNKEKAGQGLLNCMLEYEKLREQKATTTFSGRNSASVVAGGFLSGQQQTQNSSSMTNNNNNGMPFAAATKKELKEQDPIDVFHHKLIFVEVKSPSDSLSNKQRVINDLLLSLGFCVHVCRVNDVA